MSGDGDRAFRELVFGVPDMDCASCALRISGSLERMSGVEQVETRIVTKDLRVRFDPSVLEEERIADAVRSLGYTVESDGAELGGGGRLAQPTVWRGGAALRTYMSGSGIAVGLALRLLGLSPTLWSGFIWEIDLAAVLFVVAAIVGGLNFFPKGLRAARIVRLDMNFLMTIAIFGALAIGEYVEAASIAFLFGIAELLERYSVERARRSIEQLLDLAPAEARVRRGGEFVTVPVEDIEPGDRVQVMPGEKLPIDGWVREGSSSVDQSPITGESMPVAVEPPAYVYAGTMNREGYLEVEAAKRAGDTTLAHIIHLVEEAEASRSPSERYVEKFARYYTPAVTLLALAVMTIPALVLDAPFATWFVRGLTLLVISCPCALVISTPVSIVSGLTAAARRGVLIKGGVHLETAGRLRALALDKTGTLTYGRPEVRQIAPLTPHSRRELLERAAALEAHSGHPLARAVLRAARAEGIEPVPVDGFRIIKGEGAEGLIGDRLHWIGSHRMMETHGQETPQSHDMAEAMEDAGHSVVALGNDTHVCGLISISDRVREDAAESVAAMRRAGIRRIIMLTGDNEGTAAAVAQAIGVDEFRAELLPEEKLGAVSEIVTRFGPTAMVGDGVNDAPAMAASSLGIAMGAIGTDAAIETSDVALVSDDLSRIPWLIRHSRRTLRIVKMNIFFAIGLKALFMGLAVVGVATLWMAIAADMGASLLVILNGLRLLDTGRTDQNEIG